MECLVNERFMKCKKLYEDIAKDWFGDIMSTKKSPSGKFSVQVILYKRDGSTCFKHVLYLTGENPDVSPIHIIYGSQPYLSEFFVRDGVEWYHTHRHYVSPLFFNLETYEEFDNYSTKEGQENHDIIWRETDFSPDGKLVCVRGCVWGCPNETRFYDISDPLYPKYLDCEEDFNYEYEFITDSFMKNTWISDCVCRCDLIFTLNDGNDTEMVIASWEFKRVGNNMETLSTNFTPEYHTIRKNGEFILDNEFEIPKTDETCMKVNKFFTDRGKRTTMILSIPDHQSKLTENIDYEVSCYVGDTCGGFTCFWTLNNPTCFNMSIGTLKRDVLIVKKFPTIEEFFNYVETDAEGIRPT